MRDRSSSIGFAPWRRCALWMISLATTDASSSLPNGNALSRENRVWLCSETPVVQPPPASGAQSKYASCASMIPLGVPVSQRLQLRALGLFPQGSALSFLKPRSLPAVTIPCV